MYQRITVLHFNDSLQVILAARFIWRWHSNNTTTLRFQWKTCDLFFVQITWFCTPLSFRYEVWICCMISMKILFHVWNLILLKGQKYHQGSLAYFIFCIVKRQSRTVLSSVLLFFCVTCGLWPVACNLTCDLTCGLGPVTCGLHFNPAVSKVSVAIHLWCLLEMFSTVEGDWLYLSCNNGVERTLWCYDSASNCHMVSTRVSKTSC